MRRKLPDQRAQGAVVIDRFKGVSVSGDLAEALAIFTAKHRKLEDAAEASEEARLLRDAAFAEIAEADEHLDVALEALATGLTAASLAPRKAPFSGYSRHSPSKLANLAYLTEVKEIRELVAKVALKAPPAEVSAAMAACLQAAAAVEQASTTASDPQAAYDRARAERDAAALEWSKAYGKLQLRAKLAFEDAPATYQSLFAPPDEVQRPVHRRKKKTEEGPAADAAQA